MTTVEKESRRYMYDRKKTMECERVDRRCRHTSLPVVFHARHSPLSIYRSRLIRLLVLAGPSLLLGTGQNLCGASTRAHSVYPRTPSSICISHALSTEVGKEGRELKRAQRGKMDTIPENNRRSASLSIDFAQPAKGGCFSPTISRKTEH